MSMVMPIGGQLISPTSESKDFSLGLIATPFHPDTTDEITDRFCLVLDSAKTGYRIKPETYLSDRKLYSHPLGP